MATKLTDDQKKQIVFLINEKKNQLKSMSAVAVFCKVSETTISMLVNGKYATKGDDAWLQVANALGWQSGSNKVGGWQIVETTDLKSIRKHIMNAKSKHLFLGISDLAGIGKSGSLKYVAEEMKNDSVYYMRCWEWGKKEFLEQLCRNLGIDAGRGYKTPNSLLELIIEFFSQHRLSSPVLIIDEADKLKGSALRFLIPLYNELEDALGVVIAGTENLEKEIKHGVKYAKKGYDEIDSRFGRNYLKLIGCTAKDCVAICAANGINDAGLADVYFEECKPVRKLITINKEQRSIRVITDLRRLKRLIQKFNLQTV